MKQETMDHFMLTYMFIKLEFPLLRVNMYHMPQLLWQCIRCLKMNLLTFSQRKNQRLIKLLCYLPPVVNSVIKLVTPLWVMLDSNILMDISICNYQLFSWTWLISLVVCLLVVFHFVKAYTHLFFILKFVQIWSLFGYHILSTTNFFLSDKWICLACKKYSFEKYKNLLCYFVCFVSSSWC